MCPPTNRIFVSLDYMRARVYVRARNIHIPLNELQMKMK